MVWKFFSLPEDKFFSLTEDILIEILIRLPVKSLLCCKCVSKNWLRLITSSDFVRLHAEHESLNNPRILFASNSYGCTVLRSLEYETCNPAKKYDIPLAPKVNLVGSCNGLVCLSDYQTLMVLCNPATKEYVKVVFDLVEQLPAGSTQIFDLGFGYDVLTNTCKIVRMDVTCSNRNASIDDGCKLHVYTLGTKEWRRIPTPCRLSLMNSVPYLHGAFHWYRLAGTSKWTDTYKKVDSIVAFDVGSEIFRQVPNIIFEEDTGASSILKILQGCLSKYVHYLNKKCVDIWLMKDYGAKESWIKFLTIPLLEDCHSIEPLVVWENGEILLKNDGWDRKINLSTYDPERNSVKEYVHGISGWTGVYVYAESLVSIASISGGLQTQTHEEYTRKKSHHGSSIFDCFSFLFTRCIFDT